MNQQEIKAVLPHREPMLLVQTSEKIDDHHAIGTYQISGDEFFLQGHFPGNPVVPGVILCEMMAQSCCVLLAGRVQNATPYFTSLDKVKFKHPVKAGDILTSHCSIERQKGPFFFCKGKGYVKERLVVAAEFSFALVDPQ